MSKDRITFSQLVRIAEEKTWRDFEVMSDGRLVLQDRAQTILPDEEDVNPLLWVFTMRVGTHFERPMQAIMSCGMFIRMRGWNEGAPTPNVYLGKLDPANPDGCLYAQASPGVFHWHPYLETWLSPTQYPPPNPYYSNQPNYSNQPSPYGNQLGIHQGPVPSVTYPYGVITTNNTAWLSTKI